MMNAIKPSLSRLQAAFAPLASVLAGYSHMEAQSLEQCPSPSQLGRLKELRWGCRALKLPEVWRKRPSPKSGAESMCHMKQPLAWNLPCGAMIFGGHRPGLLKGCRRVAMPSQSNDGCALHDSDRHLRTQSNVGSSSEMVDIGRFVVCRTIVTVSLAENHRENRLNVSVPFRYMTS